MYSLSVFSEDCPNQHAHTHAVPEEMRSALEVPQNCH